MGQFLNYLYYVFYIVRSGPRVIGIISFIFWSYFIVIDFILSIIFDFNFLNDINFYVLIGSFLLILLLFIIYYSKTERTNKIVKEYEKKEINRLKTHLIGYGITLFPVVAFILILFFKLDLAKE